MVRKILMLSGLLEFDIFVHGDNRGVGLRKISRRKRCYRLVFLKASLLGKLHNITSFSRKNVLRGLHAEPWDKYISVAETMRRFGYLGDFCEGETFGNVYTRQRLMR